MTANGTFEPHDRAIPYAVEGDGPVSLVLLAASDLESDGLGVVAHYLAEEAGFQITRIGSRRGADAAEPSITDRVADAAAVADHLGITDTWVGGHGFGGTVARQFAATHHDRVNGLLLLGVEEAAISLAPLIPVLIIQGANDTANPPANGATLQSTAPERASVTTIDGADHQFAVTHPIETAVVIEEYLDWD
jgi:pimeloyl-ACP methyl ester carboxylesterase